MVGFRIFTIIYDVLQHYYVERHSPESWSSLLTSPLAENGKKQRRSVCPQPICQKIEEMLVLKDVKLECLVASSHVLTLKHEAKHRYITRKPTVCFLKQLKEPLLGDLAFSFSVKLRVFVSAHERTPLNTQQL